MLLWESLYIPGAQFMKQTYYNFFYSKFLVKQSYKVF